MLIAFFSLYRNVLYDSVQKKKKDSLPHEVHNFTAYVSQLKTKDCSNYKYLHVAYKKYLSWKHLKKMRYYVINYNGRNINKTLGTSKLKTLALTVNIFM